MCLYIQENKCSYCVNCFTRVSPESFLHVLMALLAEMHEKRGHFHDAKKRVLSLVPSFLLGIDKRRFARFGALGTSKTLR